MKNKKTDAGEKEPCECCEKKFPIEVMVTTKDDCWICPKCHKAAVESAMVLSVNERFEFETAFNRLAECVHFNAIDKGFYETPPSPLERLALIHEEIAEASSAFRHGNPPDDHIPSFSGAEAELADALIRIMDMAEYLELDVTGAVIAKIEYNCSRPHKHGKVI